MVSTAIGDGVGIPCAVAFFCQLKVYPLTTLYCCHEQFFKTISMSTSKKIITSVLQHGSWEEHWKLMNVPWDAGKSSPALLSIIDTFPKNQKWLVPGCGYGYDVQELYKRGHHAIGLDLSSTCVELCKEKYKQELNEKFSFICHDFFTYEDKVDGIYDYTFFCALNPDLRVKWGEQMANLIKPNGLLITLMFPIDDHEGGPPFAVHPDHYKQVLTHFNLESLTDCPSFKPRENREKLGIWKRK